MSAIEAVSKTMQANEAVGNVQANGGLSIIKYVYVYNKYVHTRMCACVCVY